MILQGILTRYHGPTNVKGSRISATTASGVRRVFHLNHALSADQNHSHAAHALANELGWLKNGEDLHGAALKGSDIAWALTSSSVLKD